MSIKMKIKRSKSTRNTPVYEKVDAIHRNKFLKVVQLLANFKTLSNRNPLITVKAPDAVAVDPDNLRAISIMETMTRVASALL